MKKIILCMLLFISINKLSAQNVTGIVLGSTFNYYSVAPDQYKFIFHTFFSMGYNPTCFPFVGYTIDTLNNTFFVRAYYDIRGNWPQVGCDRFDTVTYEGNFSSISNIHLSTNIITYDSTNSQLADTVWNVYDSTFTLNPTSINDFSTGEKLINLYPNPTYNILYLPAGLNAVRTMVMNSVGQKFSELRINKNGTIHLEQLPNGGYYFLFYDKADRQIGYSKIMKQN